MNLMPDMERSLDLYTTILRVRNVERSVEFYCRVFDLDSDYYDLSYPLASLTTNSGMRLTFWEAPAGEPLPVLTPAGGFATFVTADAVASHGEIAGRGATVSPLDYNQTGVCFFWVTDPDGHSVLVLQLLPE
jgi:catechol 2,3-dioxygenase-like lactoylglutathione lyase family enzyme